MSPDYSSLLCNCLREIPMKSIIAIFALDSKRLNTRRNVIFLLVFIIMSGFLVTHGIDYYNEILTRSRDFQTIQESYFKVWTNYVFYNDMGAKYLLVPSPSAIFFSSHFGEDIVYGHVNGVATLDTFVLKRGKMAFSQYTPFKFCFSSMAILFISLISLFLGYEATRSSEFLRSMVCHVRQGLVYSMLLSIRFLAVTLAFLLTFGLMILLVYLHGISFDSASMKGFGSFFLAGELNILFFLLIGGLFGTFKDKRFAKGYMLIFWAIVIFVIPGIVKYSVSNRIDNISSELNLDLTKFKIVRDFEKRALEKIGKFSWEKIDQIRELVEGYWNNDFKEMERLDREFDEGTDKVIHSYQNYSLLNPTTFFELTVSEASGHGYGNYSRFISFLHEARRKFLRFYFDHEYYCDPKKMEYFIEGDEDLFKGESLLPMNFATGIIINLGYILIAFGVGFFFFNRSIYHMGAQKAGALNNVNIKIAKGDFSPWLVREDHLKMLFFNLLNGRFKQLLKQGFTGKVLIEGIDIASTLPAGKNFTFIAMPSSLPPELKVKDFLKFHAGLQGISRDRLEEISKTGDLKSFWNIPIRFLDKNQKFLVSLSLLRLGQEQVYLIDDISYGLPMDCYIQLKFAIDEVESKGATVIYLAQPVFVPVNLYKRKGVYFMDGSAQIYSIEAEKYQVQQGIKSETWT